MTFEQMTKRGRQERRQRIRSKPRFHCIRKNGDVVFHLKSKGYYTQQELKTFFGIVVAVPDEYRNRVKELRKNTKNRVEIMKQLKMLVASL